MSNNTPEERPSELMEEADKVTSGYRMKLEALGLTRGKFVQLKDKVNQGTAFTEEELSMLEQAQKVQTTSRLDAQINDVVRELKHWDPNTVSGYPKQNTIRLTDIVLNELML